VGHAAETSVEATIVRQVWWKRVGVWFGVLITLQGIFGLGSSYTSAWFAYLMLGTGVIALVVGWRQGVKVTNHGIEARRLARRRNRVASWPDIERFERDRAVLHDGTTVTLFDWAGDGEAVRARLEDERLARQAAANLNDAED
jgi:hypothetical protein